MPISKIEIGLSFEGELAENQVKKYWQNAIDTHFRNQQFASVNEIIDELKSILFAGKGADDFLIDRKGQMRNLRYVETEALVPIIWGIREEVKTAKIKVRILFRLIIDNESGLAGDKLRIDPNFLEDSYLDNVQVEII